MWQNTPINITIVGLGNVGTAIAFLLLQESKYSYHINIIIKNKHKDRSGRILDLENAVYHKNHRIILNDQQLFKEADYIFHTAGGIIPLGAGRDIALDMSRQIVDDVYGKVTFSKTPFIINVANPVELTCQYLLKVLGNDFLYKIIGTGTLLDQLRFEGFLAKRLGVEVGEFHCPIIGEHGPGLIWLRQYSTLPSIEIDENIFSECIKHTINAANTIKATEGHTKYGVAACAVNIFNNILHEKKQPFVACIHTNDYYNNLSEYKGFLGLPLLIKDQKIHIINMDLTEEQKKTLRSVGNKFDKKLKQ